MKVILWSKWSHGSRTKLREVDISDVGEITLDLEEPTKKQYKCPCCGKLRE